MKLCGKYLGDNDATCPQLTCIRSDGHEGGCDNTRGDEPDAPKLADHSYLSAGDNPHASWIPPDRGEITCCDGCDDGARRYQDPVTGLWVHEPNRRESGPHPSPEICTRQR